MENREQIVNLDQLLEAINICKEIQNKEIATVFFDFSGHVNKGSIRIHVPVWIADVPPTYQFELITDEDDERNERAIVGLTEILNSGKLSIENEQQQIRQKERQARLEQYEQLKKEFEPA